jgi:hypothetical protein
MAANAGLTMNGPSQECRFVEVFSSGREATIRFPEESSGTPGASKHSLKVSCNDAQDRSVRRNRSLPRSIAEAEAFTIESLNKR